MTRSRTPLNAPALETVALRPLQSHDDFSACVQLQRDTWRGTYDICVPASLLKVSQMVGGICCGAFTPDGSLVGFVYGLTGVRDGRLIHWSHMLAVAAPYRDQGVGRRLKEYQRETLRAAGIEMMYWTYDPLVARNAHLNLNLLGTRVEQYVPDMYGDTGSDLHTFGTDRFVVSWSMESTHPAVNVPPASWSSAPIAPSSEEAASTSAAAPVIRIEIPEDVETLDVADAQSWRDATRPLFVRFLSDGYRVAGLIRSPESRCFYVLVRAGEGALR